MAGSGHNGFVECMMTDHFDAETIKAVIELLASLGFVLQSSGWFRRRGGGFYTMARVLLPKGGGEGTVKYQYINTDEFAQLFDLLSFHEGGENARCEGTFLWGNDIERASRVCDAAREVDIEIRQENRRWATDDLNFEELRALMTAFAGVLTKAAASASVETGKRKRDGDDDRSV